MNIVEYYSPNAKLEPLQDIWGRYLVYDQDHLQSPVLNRMKYHLCIRFF